MDGSFAEYEKEQNRLKAQAAAAEAAAERKAAEAAKQAAAKEAARTRSDKVWERRWEKSVRRAGREPGKGYYKSWEDMGRYFEGDGTPVQETFKRDWRAKRRKKFLRIAKVSICYLLICTPIILFWWYKGVPGGEPGRYWWSDLNFRAWRWWMDMTFENNITTKQLVESIVRIAVSIAVSIAVGIAMLGVTVFCFRRYFSK
jgi:hypothetical protein